MTQKKMISIWFWVGLVLGVYGLIITSMGVYYIFSPEAAVAGISKGEPKSEEALAAEQKARAGAMTRAETLNRTAATAERLAAAARQLQQSVDGNASAAVRLEGAANKLMGVSEDLRKEATHLTRPPVELKIMVGQVGGNPSLWWGIVMLVFGGLFLFAGIRGSRSEA
jgi:uncharacterized membrane protein